MASKEARDAAIKKAARMVRNDRTGFLSRAKPPEVIEGRTDVSIPEDAPLVGGTHPAPPPPAKPIPGMEDIAQPALVRELFRNTVTVADEDPPGMEFRLLIKRSFQTEGNVFYVTESKPLAEAELKRERKRYETWEPNTILWMEQRVVGAWTEVS